jgi:uncharacterized protein YndB with AHSA1/START domain
MAYTLRFAQTVRAPMAQVYEAFTNATHLREWLCDDAFTNPTLGGVFAFVWRQGHHVRGEFLEFVPNQLLLWAWLDAGETKQSQVEIRFAHKPDQAGAVEVTVTHSQIENADLVPALKSNWGLSMAHLKLSLETGIDARLERRAVMGLSSVAPLSEAAAAEHGLTGAMLIEGVLPDRAAERAGLRAGDILLRIGDFVTGSLPELTAAISQHTAGQTAAITVHRDGHSHSLNITFDKPPSPPVPPLPALIETIQKDFTDLADEMEAMLADVSEAEASMQPDKDAWSINMIIAHLIWSERWLHFVVHGLSNGDDRAGWVNNDLTHIAGILAAYPSKADLLLAWRAAQRETLGQLRVLPSTFMAQKSSYRRMAHHVLNFSGHTESHFVQMRDVLIAVRS